MKEGLRITDQLQFTPSHPHPAPILATNALSLTVIAPHQLLPMPLGPLPLPPLHLLPMGLPHPTLPIQPHLVRSTPSEFLVVRSKLFVAPPRHLAALPSGETSGVVIGMRRARTKSRKRDGSINDRVLRSSYRVTRDNLPLEGAHDKVGRAFPAHFWCLKFFTRFKTRLWCCSNICRKASYSSRRLSRAKHY